MSGCQRERERRISQWHSDNVWLPERERERERGGYHSGLRIMSGCQRGREREEDITVAFG